MKKRTIYRGLATLCFVAAGAMWYIGGNSGHLTELRDFYWTPLPLGVVLSLMGARAKN